MAIAYDFDGTLAPGNMQEYNFIPDLNMDKGAFGRRPMNWRASTIWTKCWPTCT